MSVRTEVIRLFVMVLVVDAVAIAIYYFAGFATAAGPTRFTFTAAWMIVSLLVVLVGLTRVRRARRLR